MRIEEEGAALELELAMKKTRKMNTKIDRVNILKDIAEKVKVFILHFFLIRRLIREYLSVFVSNQ